MGLGVTMLAVPDALPALDSGTLVRLLTDWYADAGGINLYYSTRILLPAKTRAFVDHLVSAFAREKLTERFAGNGPTE